jgi:protein-disulfide isomerase
MNDTTKILLFVSRDSIYFQVTLDEFQHVLTALEAVQPFTSEVIDINEKPDMAETYKIDALPTMIIGDKRFIGKPDTEKILAIIKNDAVGKE